MVNREDLKKLVMIRQERINETVEAVLAGLDEGNINLENFEAIKATSHESLEELFAILESKRDEMFTSEQKELIIKELETNKQNDQKEAK